MLLKSLELQGFKTFPDKTTLKFENGITAVVGPNGSGKSNISDAMRWVLGEQSTRALRCSKMEDIIFSGTPQRKAQGFCEVTVTMDNTDRELNYDGDTVSVTRRFYRSGESEYRINKTLVQDWAGRDIPISDRDELTKSCLSKARTAARFLKKPPAFRAFATAKRKPNAAWKKPKKTSFACTIF